MTSPGSSFSFQPDPPKDGTEVTVTYTGSAPFIYYSIDGRKGKKIRVPKNTGGKGFKFKIPPSYMVDGTYLFLDDRTRTKDYRGFAWRKIQA